MNKKVSQQDSKKKRRKLGFWWWLGGGVASLSLLVTLALANPFNNQTSSGITSSSTNQVSSSISSPVSSLVELIAVEVDKLPSKVNYQSTETISTSGGTLRLVYSDYSVKYVSMTDSMIDQSRLNMSQVGTGSVTIRFEQNGVVLFVNYPINIVPFEITLTKLSIDIGSSDILTNQTISLNPIFEPFNATYSNIVWTSSNPNIASVDQLGVVTAKSSGEVIISVTVNNNLSANTKLTVKNPPQRIVTGGGFRGNSEPTRGDRNDWIPIANGHDLMMIGMENASYVFAKGKSEALEFIDDSPGLGGKYYLLNDINLANFNNSDYSWTSMVEVNSIIPIGKYFDEDNNQFYNDFELGFFGEFDGRFNSIDNMKIDYGNNPDTLVGLFSVIDGGEVYDLEINNAFINSNFYLDKAGVLAGLVTPDSFINNIDVSGVIANGDYEIGGLIGNYSYYEGYGSSTPFVFTKDENGQFNYVNELGMLLPRFTKPDDWAILDSEKIALQDDGSYHINMTAEFNEIVYMDEVNLMIFDHSDQYQITNSMLRSNQLNNANNFKLVPNSLSNITLAIDQFGNNVTSKILQPNDGLWTDFGLEDNDFLNEITLNLGDQSLNSKIVLLINSVIDYDLSNSPSIKYLKFQNKNGEWINGANLDTSLLSNNLILPVAAPRLYHIDLSNAFEVLDNDNQIFNIKIGFNKVVYDYIAVSNELNNDYDLTTLDPDYANLDYRGFSKKIEPTASNPYKVFDYSDVRDYAEDYYGFQSGNFTKYGDILPLVSDKDSMLAVLRYGDEVQFKFNHSEVENNLKRSFVLNGAIWYKHAERETGRTVEPMPFNGMNSYPFYTNGYPAELELYKTVWNTRYVAPKNSTELFNQLSLFQPFNGYIMPEFGIFNSNANVDVTGNYAVGGLIGFSYGASYEYDNNALIYNSSAGGNVKGQQSVGGLIGYGYNIWIEDSSSTSLISPSTHLDQNNLDLNSLYTLQSNYYNFGGLVGYLASGVTQNLQLSTIDNSFYNGTIDFTIITPEDYTNNLYIFRIGGLIGYAYDDVNINNSHSTGEILFDITTDYNYIYLFHIGGFIGYADENVYVGLEDYNPGLILGKFDNLTFEDLEGEPVTLSIDNYYYDVENFIFYTYSNAGFVPVNDYDNIFNSADYNSYSDIDIEIILETSRHDIYVSEVGGFIGSAEGNIVLFNILSKGTIDIDITTLLDLVEQSDSDIAIYDLGGLIGEADDTNVYHSSSIVEIIIVAETREDESNINVFNIGGAFGYFETDSDENLELLNINSSGELSLNLATFGEQATVSANRLGGLIGYAETSGSFISIYGTDSIFDINIESINTNNENNNTLIEIYDIGGFAGKLYGRTNEKISLIGITSIGNVTFESIITDNANINVFSIGGFVGLADNIEIIDVISATNIEIQEIKINDNTTRGIEVYNLGGLIGNTFSDFKFDKLVVDSDIKIFASTFEASDGNRTIDIYNISGLFGYLTTSVSNDLNLLEFDLMGLIEIEAFNNFDGNIFVSNIGSLIGDLVNSLLEIEEKFDLSTPTIDQFLITVNVADESTTEVVNNINKFVGVYDAFALNELATVDPVDISIVISGNLTLPN